MGRILALKNIKCRRGVLFFQCETNDVFLNDDRKPLTVIIGIFKVGDYGVMLINSFRICFSLVS